jgi:hypothetical protein
MNTQGIIYKVTGESGRGTVQRYHHKPSPKFLNKSPYRVDVMGLKPIEQRTNVLIEGREFKSRFTIGFEVEKNSLHRGAVKEYELFCGFEMDGSCGYEAVTHVLPLLPTGTWRNKVFDMMYKAEKIIDDNYSPSDKRCGGHVTVAVDGMIGSEILKAVREYSGIILALFRHRLKNAYCGMNTNMRVFGEYNEFNANDDRGAQRYQLALVKGNCLEFRVVSRFESVKQMMRRYELFYALLNFAINVKGKPETFLKQIRPIVVSMYNGEEDKANEIIGFAKHFQKFINTGIIHEDIKRYLF